MGRLILVVLFLSQVFGVQESQKGTLTEDATFKLDNYLQAENHVASQRQESQNVLWFHLDNMVNGGSSLPESTPAPESDGGATNVVTNKV